MPKFFRLPFALGGDKTPIPDATQIDGSVSFNQGYTTDYTLEQPNPNAKNIERLKMNNLFFDLSENAQFWQTFGVYDFITPAMNNGVPYPYAIEARVLYLGNVYRSLVAANTSLPSIATDWVREDKGFIAELLVAGEEGKVLSARADLLGYELQAINPRTLKNAVINGDFLINQRGTAFVVGGYGVDQWEHAFNPDGGSLVSLTHGSLPFALGQTEVPENPARHAYFSGYVAGGGGLKHVVFRQRIESVIPYSGKEVTLSFWAKGSNSGVITLALRQSFGTGGSPSAGVNTPLTQNISLTTDWQKFTFTAVMPSISGKTLGTNFNDFRLLEFSTETGAAIAAEYGTAPVSYQGTVQLSDVQFEAGNNATAFERLLFGAQMSLCRRYFQNNFIAGVTATVGRALDGTTLVHTHIPFSIMRTAPSATMTTPSNFGGVLRIDSNGSIPDGPITVVPVSNSGLRFFSSHTGAAGARLYGGEVQSNFAIFLSAEL